MRWDELFADLEGLLRAEERQELDAEVADRVRLERARVGLFERLAATRGRTITVHCAGAGVVRGALDDLGDGWVLLTGGRAAGHAAQGGGQALVPLGVVRAIDGLAPRADLTAAPARRFGFGHALRAVARDRVAVRLVDLDGTVREGHLVGVGADVVDLREHPVDVPGRNRESGRVVAVPHAAVAAVLSGGW